jgi:hypothetical protein
MSAVSGMGNYHENVAQASSLHEPRQQARCLRYVFIMLGCRYRGMTNPSE